MADEEKKGFLGRMSDSIRGLTNWESEGRFSSPPEPPNMIQWGYGHIHIEPRGISPMRGIMHEMTAREIREAHMRQEMAWQQHRQQMLMPGSVVALTPWDMEFDHDAWEERRKRQEDERKERIENEKVQTELMRKYLEDEFYQLKITARTLTVYDGTEDDQYYVVEFTDTGYDRIGIKRPFAESAAMFLVMTDQHTKQVHAVRVPPGCHKVSDALNYINRGTNRFTKEV